LASRRKSYAKPKLRTAIDCTSWANDTRGLRVLGVTTDESAQAPQIDRRGKAVIPTAINVIAAGVATISRTSQCLSKSPSVGDVVVACSKTNQHYTTISLDTYTDLMLHGNSAKGDHKRQIFEATRDARYDQIGCYVVGTIVAFDNEVLSVVLNICP